MLLYMKIPGRARPILYIFNCPGVSGAGRGYEEGLYMRSIPAI